MVTRSFKLTSKLPATDLQSEDEDCNGQLEDFENIVSVFLTYLEQSRHGAHRDAQLKGEGYRRIMNLIDDYWKEDEEFEDQE